MSDKKPLYKQIMDKLKERIKSGDFEYDAPFVTEDRITKEYGVSRITAIRALEELEHDGLINRKRGSGSFVSKNAIFLARTRKTMPQLRYTKKTEIYLLWHWLCRLI